MATERTDRVLAIIDTGLQTPAPDPSFGEISPKNHDRCTRCHRDREEESEFCGGCREWLLGDSDIDPMVPAPGSLAGIHMMMDEEWQAQAERTQHLIQSAMMTLQEALTPIAEMFVQFKQMYDLSQCDCEKVHETPGERARRRETAAIAYWRRHPLPGRNLGRTARR